MCRMSSAPASPAGPLEDSQALGRMEAERFEAALREQERREREDRLARLDWGSEDLGNVLAAGPTLAGGTAARQSQGHGSSRG